MQNPFRPINGTLGDAARRLAPREFIGFGWDLGQTLGRDLAWARYHAPAVARERSILIAARVRVIAALFAVLTVAWIGVDAMTLAWPVWGEIAIGRVATAGGFAGLTLLPHRRPAIAVGLLVAVPIAFFLNANATLSATAYEGTIAVSTAYFYLPFIVAVGLSIFPLTALEATLPAGITICAMVLALRLWPEFLGGQSAEATLWRLCLVTGIAVLAGLSQLRFLLRLTDQATRDGLTNLLVRGTGEEILESQLAYAERHDQPFALLFIDIDHFKEINDKFGHDSGDAALRAIAVQIARAFRHQDVLIRWGGEEFVIGLPGANPAHAEIAVLRLAKLGLGLRPDYQPITASIGIAERKADGITTLAGLVERADQRMYKAKAGGRNRYVFQGEPKLWLAPERQVAPAA